jgi:hypothetical protein
MTTANQLLMDGEVANALTADRYTQWVACNQLRELGFAIFTPGTGSPVGTFSLEGSNDSRVVERERASGVAPSATTAKKFPITPTVVHGSPLAITGSAAQATYVTMSGGLPRYLRVKFAWTSGGTTGSVPTISTAGR